jgi:outer membrane receptor protein involved in Fe transport
VRSPEVDTMLQISSLFGCSGCPKLTPWRLHLPGNIMRLASLLFSSLSVLQPAWAQPAPTRAATDLLPAAAQGGAKQRSEIKAAVNGDAGASAAPAQGLDAAQRQQLRRQLREQNGR